MARHASTIMATLEASRDPSKKNSLNYTKSMLRKNVNSRTFLLLVTNVDLATLVISCRYVRVGLVQQEHGELLDMLWQYLYTVMCLIRAFAPD
jgi:hypothetical protein